MLYLPKTNGGGAMEIKLPDEVRYIIDTLENGGFEAYAVGGCVRDSLLGRTPSDWDVCTSALPEQAMQCFDGCRIIETGLRHGTITLMLNNQPFEVTTYRVDGKYTDNRRPDSVRFVNVLKRDLARRDFTVNAMAYNPKTGVVDYYGGRQDLASGKIKCVGNADKRFKEDALRIMRALRFASVFGFSIDSDTASAMRGNKKLLRNIAAERIATELNKLLLGDGVCEILSEHTEIIAEIIPEIIGSNISYGVENAPKDVILRLTMLFSGIGSPDAAESILSRLKYDNDTIKAVSQLILYRFYEITDGRDIKKLLNKIGEERFRQLIEIKKARAMALADGIRQNTTAELSRILSLTDEIIGQRQCYALKDLAVNGGDLIAAGVPEGVQIGIILNRLLNLVIDGEAENDKAVLIGKAEKY